MTASAADNTDDGQELLFVPLGGAGEIGMNLNLYGYGGKWVMVDLGVTFAEDGQPGVDVVVPDPAFIVDRRDDLLGLVLTHAHEDHLGAVPYLWPQLRCPIFATPFTAAMLRGKLEYAGLIDEFSLTEVPLGGTFALGDFGFELVTLTHSIPEPNGLIIHTPLGTVMHTGDWKLDPDPLVGERFDDARLRRLGDDGVLAMICDSTNALTPGESGSEAALRESLIRVTADCPGRIAIACFASNVARLETVAAVAAAHDRHAALIGRSLWRVYEAARGTGYLTNVRFLGEEEARELPRDKLVFACTGSQGEPRAALARIAAGDHPAMSLGEGDMAIFSSRVIPGNERSIFRLHNDLVRLGVEVITEKDHFVHVSGHPARDELLQMYQWVRPRIAVPVHGELRHMRANAALARDCQVPETVVPENGAVLRLAPGPAAIVDWQPARRLAIEGPLLLDLDGETMRERRRMMFNGTASASLVVDGAGTLVTEPDVGFAGLVDDEDLSLAELAVAAIKDAVAGLSASARADDDEIAEAARRAVRRTVAAIFGKRPVTTIHVTRL